MIKAYYGTKRGGSGIRSIRNESEALKILKGGFGVTDVRLEDKNGIVVGVRQYRPDLDMPNGAKWWWYYDLESFTPDK